MALSPAFLTAHIADWEARLSTFRDYRAKWPSRLFHHTSVDNAVTILQSGNLLSRQHSENIRTDNVAGVEVIAARDRAHQFARLYFRPKTPTQYHVEGIRREEEVYQQAKASILVMLVFRAEAVLTQPDVRFSDCNMQSGYASDGDTEAFFQGIDFEKVYHDWATNDAHTRSCRCAEVLARSPMPIRQSIQWVYCRSTAERQTLLHLLGPAADGWAPIIRVSDDLQVFQKDYTYVETASLSAHGVSFDLHPRRDGRNVNIDIQVWASNGLRVVHFANSDFAPVPQQPYKGWITRAELKPDEYAVEIRLEGQRAYRAVHPLDAPPF